MFDISIIMVVYDGDDTNHFEEALVSLYPNNNFYDELVLVINGEISKLKKKIIEKFQDDLKIKPIFLSTNIGLAKGLNIALKNVKNEWIARFDSDDINSQNRFYRIQKYINEYGRDFDVMGTFISEFEFNLKDNKKYIRKVPLDLSEIKRRLIYRSPMNHVSVFFKKEIFDKGNFYPLIDGFEDYALWVKLISKGYKFKNFPEITVYVRTGASMVKRRGGLKYILKEFKLRFFFMKYINPALWPINFLVLFLRVFAFSLSKEIKKFIYLFIRKLQ